MSGNICINDNCLGFCSISSMKNLLTKNCKKYLNGYVIQNKAYFKAQLEKKIAEFSKLEERLKICNDQNVEFNNIIFTKSEEISQLNNQLQTVNSQLIEKQAKIQKLQEKIEILSEQDN